jgi:hypothetical protein
VAGTAPFGINDFGNLSIQVTLSDGSFWVGTRINGKYSTLSQPPGTENGTAVAEDINNPNIVVGSFYNGSGYTGFLLTNGVYTDFKLNVRNPTTTAPIGINDYGVISGIYGTSKVSNQAFRQFGAKETDLQVPDATGTAATGTNDVLQTVGYFSVLASESALPLATCCQSVIWDQIGHPTPFAVIGAVSTVALGINNIGWVCGRYYDGSGNEHAFVYNQQTRKLLTYKYPGATDTTFNGINDLGYIAGRYTENNAENEPTEYGFVARIVGE